MSTCEYETDIDVDPSPERCGKPATAQAADGATDEVHYVCNEHTVAVEGFYEITPIGCTSDRHDRTSCDKAFCNGEIAEDEWCPTCLVSTSLNCLRDED